MTYPQPVAPSGADATTVGVWETALVSQFPEFADAPSALVQSRITIALDRTPEEIWDTDHTAGVLYLAAHLIALSPGGEKMRIDNVTTLYGNERAKMARSVASGWRVAGVD